MSAQTPQAALRSSLLPHPSHTTSIITAVEALMLRLTTALNERDFTDETWHGMLAASFRLDTDDTRRWGFTKGWSREQTQKGISEAASKFPDWNMKILQMDTSVDVSGQIATVVANAQSTLGGLSRRSVMTLECARLESGWCGRSLNIMTGLDMGAMEVGMPF